MFGDGQGDTFPSNTTKENPVNLGRWVLGRSELDTIHSSYSRQVRVCDNKHPDPGVHGGGELHQPLHADPEQLHHELIQQAGGRPLLLPHVDLAHQERASLD